MTATRPKPDTDPELAAMLAKLTKPELQAISDWIDREGKKPAAKAKPAAPAEAKPKSLDEHAAALYAKIAAIEKRKSEGQRGAALCLLALGASSMPVRSEIVV